MRQFKKMIEEDIVLSKDKQIMKKKLGTDLHPCKNESELHDIFGE